VVPVRKVHYRSSLTSLGTRTVDSNEEFSAFHGQTLLDQSTYVAHAIDYILSLYPTSSNGDVRSVWLVGHSMGGVVARHAITRRTTQLLQDAVHPTVNVIITMSTPHLFPPVPFDRGIQRVYNDVAAFWSNRSTSLPILVSICGGVPDGQISSDACALPPTPSPRDPGTFAVFTTGMDGVWTGVEHQAMVWCDQVRWRVARALLEMTARKGRSSMVNVARHWFLGEIDGAMEGAASQSPGGRTLTLSPNNPSFINRDHDSVSLRVPIPQPARQFQLSHSIELRDLGTPSLWHRYTLRLCPADGSERCRRLPITISRMLPPSPLSRGEEPAFPLPGRGIRGDEGMVYLAADLPAVEGAAEIVLEAHGEGWGVVGFATADGTAGKWSLKASFPSRRILKGSPPPRCMATSHAAVLHAIPSQLGSRQKGHNPTAIRLCQ
jgi:pimeloyl-ACP methyl ester carboxylesterase